MRSRQKANLPLCSHSLPAHTESWASFPALMYSKYIFLFTFLWIVHFIGLVFRKPQLYECSLVLMYYYEVISSYSHLDHLCMHKCIYAFIYPPHTHTQTTLPSIVTQLSPTAGVYILRCVCLCVEERGCWRWQASGWRWQAAAVWIKGSVLVSDKHWISAIISPLLAWTWNWGPGLSSRTCLD